MSHGTASNQLKKKLLFKYISLANENFCFQCGAEIESSEELSVEHKVPWLYESVDLFWDLENIAFSHMSCNSGAARNAAIKGESPCPRGHTGHFRRYEGWSGRRCMICHRDNMRERRVGL